MLLRFALERHDHFLVRYAVRALLMRDVAFEEDPEFKMAARSLADSIESSLNLRVATTLLETGADEFLDEDDGGRAASGCGARVSAGTKRCAGLPPN